MSRLMNLEEKQELLRDRGFEIATASDPDLPAYVHAHINEYGGPYIIWDPLDDEDGFKLSGGDLGVLTQEAVELLELT